MGNELVVIPTPTVPYASLADWTKSILAVGMVTLLSATIVALFIAEIPLQNKEAILLMLGVLSGSMNQVYGYFFGTSQQQSRSNEIIKSQADTIQTAQTTLSAIAPPGTDTMTIKPGDEAKVEANVDGTTNISKNPDASKDTGSENTPN